MLAVMVSAPESLVFLSWLRDLKQLVRACVRIGRVLIPVSPFPSRMYLFVKNGQEG